jgi:hypothetical protein
MIRHARPPRFAKGGLSITMICRPFRALLVALVVPTARLATVARLALVGAIHRAAIAETVEADDEAQPASTALALNCYHDVLRRESEP